MGNKLYIGNLNFDTTDEELEQALDPTNYTGSSGEIVDRIVGTIEKGP